MVRWWNWGLCREAPGGVRVAVGVGDVGLDVVDGGAVHQVGTPHDEDGADVRPVLDGFQLDAGQSQRSWAGKGEAGGKYAHPGVAAEAGRPDGGGPAVPHRAGKLPHQQMWLKSSRPRTASEFAVFGGKK